LNSVLKNADGEYEPAFELFAARKSLHREAIHVEDLEEYAFHSSSHRSWLTWLKRD